MAFQFANATLTPSSGGKYAGDSPVNQTFTFMAPLRDLLKVDPTAAAPPVETNLTTLANPI